MLELLAGLVLVLLSAILAGGGWMVMRLEKMVHDTNDTVRLQLRPNGNTSLYDKVADIQARLKVGDKVLEGHAERLEKLENA